MSLKGMNCCAIELERSALILDHHTTSALLLLTSISDVRLGRHQQSSTNRRSVKITAPMGMCGSCLRLFLDVESDVKIHVIEPTSVGIEHSTAAHSGHAQQQERRSGPTLQVPDIHRATRDL
ncbi:hypothetical protein Q1695_000044 [Nippostrongylus brasiliensis]|nr:hypothetical protein Q1695_000044 [Nippostrongylus brasiliensis]